MRRATGAVREGEGIYARKLATRPVFAVFFRPWWRSPGNSSLRFSLNSADGRRVLALRPHLLWELVAVERLELEVPSQAGDPSPTEEAAAAPGTAAAEAQLARWQTRRCRLLRSRLSIDAERLERWLGTRRLVEHGIADLSLRIADGLAVIALTAGWASTRRS